MKLYIIDIFAIAVLSIIAFILYGVDKRRAKRGEWRIKEIVLLFFSFFGGAIGGILGMKVFRHKTKHAYFWIVNLLGLAWQVALVVYLIIKDI